MSLTSAPAYSFPHKSDHKNDKEIGIPGPGAYTLNEYHSGFSPSWKIGKSQRSVDKAHNYKAGPGAYDIVQTNTPAPSYTFSLKQKQNRADETPGPGEYQVMSSIMNRTGCLKFGKTKKLISKPDDVPGPGAYNVEQSKISTSKATKFPRSSRSFIENMSGIPGPGEYNLNETFRSQLPQIESSFGTDVKNKNRKSGGDMPGPGKYDIEGMFDSNKLTHKKGSSMPRGERTMYDQKFMCTQPGPGYYDIEQFLLRKSSGGTMNKAKRSEHYDSNPGPQKYDISDLYELHKRGTKFSQQKRHTSFPRNYNPGPGSYNPQTPISSSGPQYTLSKSKNKSSFDSSNKNLIGPGQYNTNYAKVNNKSIRIGTEKRQFILKDDQSPGPGLYEIRAMYRQGITIPEARKSEHVDSAPGPGHYEAQCGVGNLPTYSHKSKRA